jgi:CRP-like cAMP-binding protein
MDQKLVLLAKVPLLAGLQRKDLEAVARLADEIDVPEGRVVARQGSHGEEFFVIVDGTVRVDHDGEVLRELGPGDFFGEMAMLGKVPRTASVTCTSPCRLLVVGHREFNSLLSDYPSIQNAVLHAVAERIARLEEHHTH